MRISGWSSDVCSSDLDVDQAAREGFAAAARQGRQAEPEKQDEGRKRDRVDRRPVARRHNAAGNGEARGKKAGDEEQKRVAGQREIVRYGSRDPATRSEEHNSELPSLMRT